jgi:REP element-mobilizing transposase RayT
VTQRGNGRATTFFNDEDCALYRDLLGRHCAAAGVEIWAWVLMPNHVHLILVPSDADGIRRALAAVHRRYAGHVHARLRRTGHFWQGRFGYVAMDEEHLGAALCYVALGRSLQPREAAAGKKIVHCHRNSSGYGGGASITRPTGSRRLSWKSAFMMRVGLEVTNPERPMAEDLAPGWGGVRAFKTKEIPARIAPRRDDRDLL